jgi:hypothetical protein
MSSRRKEGASYDRLLIASFGLRGRHVGDASVMSGSEALDFLD